MGQKRTSFRTEAHGQDNCYSINAIQIESIFFLNCLFLSLTRKKRHAQTHSYNNADVKLYIKYKMNRNLLSFTDTHVTHSEYLNRKKQNKWESSSDFAKKKKTVLRKVETELRSKLSDFIWSEKFPSHLNRSVNKSRGVWVIFYSTRLLREWVCVGLLIVKKKWHIYWKGMRLIRQFRQVQKGSF